MSGPLYVEPPAFTPYSGDAFWPIALDGARSESGGGSATDLDRPRLYSTLSITSTTSLRMAGQKLIVTDTLTLGTNCILHNDGASATSTGGASGGALQGHLASGPGPTGGAGGVGAGNGGNGNGANPGMGGSGGKGGNSNDGHTGGLAGNVTLPNWSSVGLLLTPALLDLFACWNGNSFTRFLGGASGGGGSGSGVGPGYGAGQGGGLAWLRAKRIVLGSGARISCRGGNGATPSAAGAGGGGGGGGGFLVIWCDEFSGDYTQVDCAPGSGAAGQSGGASGDPGVQGRVLIFQRGVLVYSSGW